MDNLTPSAPAQNAELGDKAMSSSYLPGKFVWFEHYGPDIGGARAFYKNLFGWNSDPLPIGAELYPMFMHANTPFGGFRSALPATPASWLCWLSVPFPEHVGGFGGKAGQDAPNGV